MKTRDFTPLWSDSDRRRQLVRLRSARFRISQMNQANTARQAALALEASSQAGTKPLSRVPRASAFDAVLQVFALAKSFSIGELELSVADYAELTGQGASSVKRVFKALNAIGWLTTTRRFGMAVIDGMRKAVHRTAVRGLSLIASNVLFSGGDDAKQSHGPGAEQGAGCRPQKGNPASAQGAARQPSAANRLAAPEQDEPQSAEAIRRDLMEVMRKTPFLKAWVDRSWAVV